MFWEKYWQSLGYSIFLPPAPIIYFFLTIFSDHFSDENISLPGFLGFLTAWGLFVIGIVGVGELCSYPGGSHHC